MKRLAISLEQLAERSNLVLATWKAARGKRQRPPVARFLGELDARLDRLAASILNGEAPQGQYTSFTIHDPKRRLIHAACFADRVLQHAILNLAEPRFETMLVDSSYACRPGKGVHAAARQVQYNLQRFAWRVQVDVDGYFPSIDHACLKALLTRRFKDDGFLALLGRIIDTGGAAGRGLPIGSLTSQHFANAYLDAADRWLLEDHRVRAHVRYMDDTLWWCGYPVNSAACLQGKKCCRARAARRFLEQQRQERPLSEPQRQRARQRQPEQRFPLCPELDRRRVWQHPGMDLPLPMDQALFPVAVAWWPPSKLEGSRGAGSEGAAALTRQLPGSPPAACLR